MSFLQYGSMIGDKGACRLGDGLKANNSLLILDLVRIFAVFFCCFGGGMQEYRMEGE